MAEISQFIALVKNEGLARSNRFVVYITPPPDLVGSYPDAKLRFYCDAASLPGLNFLSNPVHTYGEQREVIYNRSFEPVNLEFLMDQTMEIKQFFDAWQALMIHPVSRVVNYYRDYIGTVEIYQLDHSDQEKTKYVVRLHEAFPKSVAAISYSAGSKDVTKLSVSIEYKYWVPLQVETGAQQSNQEFGAGNGPGAGGATQFGQNGLNGQTSLDVPSQGSGQTPQ